MDTVITIINATIDKVIRHYSATSAVITYPVKLDETSLKHEIKKTLKEMFSYNKDENINAYIDSVVEKKFDDLSKNNTTTHIGD